jgi:superfamily II DNA/RNA helicase
VKSLAYHAKLASASLCDQPTAAKRVAAVTRRPIDVLVSTPGRLLEMLQSRTHPSDDERSRGRGGGGGSRGSGRRHGGRQPKAEPTLYLSDARFVVFDEADVLFDDEFGPTLLPMLRRMLRTRDKWDPGSQPAKLQCILAGASWPGAVQSDREREQNASKGRGRAAGAVRAQSGGLHRLPAGLELSFRLVAGGQGKPDALLETLRHLRPNSATMVFTNTTKAAVYVTAMLREEAALAASAKEDGGGGGGGRLASLEVCGLHGAMGPAERQAEFEIFNTLAQDQDQDEEEGGESGDSIRVLVSTDVGSRGLDLSGVEHVVMFGAKNATFCAIYI